MVEIKELEFGYGKGYPLFDRLSLELKRGSIYGLFGVNGAGKTTLIRHIAGLLFPKSGMVRVLDFESKKRHVEMMRELFVIPEEFRLPSLTINKYVEIHQGFYPSFDKTIFQQILKEFEVMPQSNLQHLSYGQKKKFMISFGISTRCGLLLMDEPTNGLDIPSKSQFRKIMATHISDEMCVLISTHQVRDLSSIIDHVIILDNGIIKFHESTGTITDTFSFGIRTTDDMSNVVYCEDIFGGKAVISTNSEKHTEIDFELLFNGVIKNAQEINNSITRRS
jgi:ABC-2 type transport system ATP-binding protein